MRVAIWDDARDDAIFFREEKGADLVPPGRVPPHVTGIEVCVANVERLWPRERAGAVVAVSGLGSEKAVEVEKSKRGPKPKTFERVKSEMASDLSDEIYTPKTLNAEKEIVLATRYKASRDTIRKARLEILSEIRARK
jgi:hypothetical protein